MNDATLGIIGTIVGTVLGFGLSELSTWFRERRAVQQRVGAVRQLLVMDITGYIEALEHTLQHVWISQPGGVVHSHTSPTPLFQQILIATTARCGGVQTRAYPSFVRFLWLYGANYRIFTAASSAARTGSLQ